MNKVDQYLAFSPMFSELLWVNGASVIATATANLRTINSDTEFASEGQYALAVQLQMLWII